MVSLLLKILRKLYCKSFPQMQVNIPEMDCLGYLSVQQDVSYKTSSQHCIICRICVHVHVYVYVYITESASCGAIDG